MKKEHINKILTTKNIIFRLLSTCLLFNIINILHNTNNNYDITFSQNLNIFLILIGYLIIFIILSFITYILKKEYIDYIITNIFLLIYSLLFLKNDENIIFIILLFLIFLLIYNFKPKNLNIKEIIPKNKKQTIIIISIMSIFMFSIISIITVLRYKTFTSPNFDLGISSQNFYYLKKIGIPYSTCERNKLISHFTVHISPIYYLILPIYFLFSTPLTLQIISSLIISSAIIPLYLLTKNYNFKSSMSLLICLIYSLYTPAICSIIYDFHENIFLTPLLLWIFYFYEKNKKIPFIITSILILMIKEDSAIYLIIFGIYTLFDNKKQYGISLIIFSFLYFIIAIHLLNNYGEGIMMDRYDNLTYNNSGILGIIKTFLINPGYFLKQLILSKDNDINKIKYLVQLLLPLGFIPLYSKKGKNYILLIPILLTIMTTYIYSYDINFHYSCGIIAFLFYLFIINIKDLKIKGYLSLCFIASILTFKVYAFPHLYDNINNYLTNKYEFEQIEKILKEIPQNASVNASTFLLPHLANRDIIYEIYYHNNEPDINYVVYDMRYDDNIESIDEYLKKGYSKIDNKETNKILVLKK